MQDSVGMTVLHDFICSRRSIQGILELLSESQRLPAVEMRTSLGETVLNMAASTRNIESIKDILTLYPESRRLQAVCTVAGFLGTALHRATESEHTIKTISDLIPQSQHSQVLCSENGEGDNGLFWAARCNNFQSLIIF